jgi:hypothetical protein
MRSNTSSSPTRRSLRQADSRSARRPALVVGGLALTVLATCGVVGAPPASNASAGGTLSAFSLASYEAPAVSSGSLGADASVRAASVDPATAEAAATAQGALDAAASVTADIQASGLDLGEPDTAVDTAALDDAFARLQNAGAAMDAFLPALAADVATAAAPVQARVAHLRGSLDAARERRAAEEAAEKARQEAEAAARAAEAEKARAATQKAAAPASPSAAAPVPAVRVSGGSAGEAQAIARDMLAARGWGDDQFSCLVALWNKESGWNYAASNRSSGAYGIPQALPGSKMASAGADWQTNPATQITWGLGYISGRYGTPCGAWSHSQSVGWY